MLKRNTAMVFNTQQFPQNYYVYAFLRETDLTPYYIGKGIGKRAFATHGRRVSAPKDKNRIIILYQNLTENQAYNIEILLIDFYGREDLGTGRLLNMTSGGDGRSKIIVKEETREKLSNANKGKNNPMFVKTAWNRGQTKETNQKLAEIGNKLKGNKAWNVGVPHTDEAKNKMSISRKGRKLSEEHKRKLSESKRGDKNPNFGKIPWNKK
jgi:hypothetical protein